MERRSAVSQRSPRLRTASHRLRYLASRQATPPGDGMGPHPHPPAYGAGLRTATAGTLVSAYLLLVLGDTVRVTESGMGCSSWPLCNGQLGLSGTYHALLEQSHRYLAAVVTVLVAATFTMAWRQARRDRLVYVGAATAVGLIGVQVLLGAITVWLRNAGWTVELHLAGAWLLVGAITVTALGVWRAPALTDQRQPTARVAPAGRVGPVAVVSLLGLAVSGMLVLHGGASNACPGWPTCGGGAGATGLVALQYLHRSLGLVATVAVAAAAIRALRSASAGRAGRMLAGAALVLLAATAVFGALVATTGSPPAEQDLHLAVASALWIAVVALATPGAPSRAAGQGGLGRAVSQTAASRA
jgi:heme A synthase